MEEMVIELHCSPGVEFVKGSSEEKVEGIPEYLPTSPPMDWDAVTDKITVGPDEQDSLDEDSLEDLTISLSQISHRDYNQRVKKSNYNPIIIHYN
jgi:hypothetical protein